MSWERLPADVRDVAEQILTEKQLEAWCLELNGLGMQLIGRRLGITKGAAVSRIDGAHLKLEKAGVRQDAFGRWTLDKEIAA